MRLTLKHLSIIIMMRIIFSFLWIIKLIGFLGLQLYYLLHLVNSYLKLVKPYSLIVFSFPKITKKVNFQEIILLIMIIIEVTKLLRIIKVIINSFIIIMLTWWLMIPIIRLMKVCYFIQLIKRLVFSYQMLILQLITINLRLII